MRSIRNLSMTLPFAFALISLLFLSDAFAASHDQLRAFMAKRYDPAIKAYEVSTGLSGSQCNLSSVYISGKDPVSGDKRDVVVKQYRPGANMLADSGRAIILMPPTGGENILDNKWANAFCKRGFRVALIQSWELIPESGVDIRQYDRTALRALVAMLHTSTYLTQSGAKSIGILGTSLGAIQATAAVGYDPRIKAAALIVGGIELHEIIAASNEQTIGAMRETRRQMWNMTQDQYRAALDKAITIEPGDFIGMSGPKRVFTVIGTVDSTVPTANQRKLWEAFGKQELIEMNKDHFNTIKDTALWKTVTIADFFNETL